MVCCCIFRLNAINVNYAACICIPKTAAMTSADRMYLRVRLLFNDDEIEWKISSVRGNFLEV